MHNVNLVKKAGYALAFIAVGAFIFWLISTTPGAKPIKEQLAENHAVCVKECNSAKYYVDSKVALAIKQSTELSAEIDAVQTDIANIRVELVSRDVANSIELRAQVVVLEQRLDTLIKQMQEAMTTAGGALKFCIVNIEAQKIEIDILRARLDKLEKNVVDIPKGEHSIVVRRCKPRLFCK